MKYCIPILLLTMSCKTTTKSTTPAISTSDSVTSTPPKDGKMQSKTNLATTSEECVSLIKNVVKNKRNQVKFCYDNELRENPILEGKMVLEFAIKSGVVEKFTISKNTTNSKTLEICVEKKVTQWEFPRNCSEDLARLVFSLSPE